MSKNNDPYKDIMKVLKKQQPELEHPSALTRQIMDNIRKKNSIQKQIIFSRWVIPGIPAIAAIFLIGLFVVQFKGPTLQYQPNGMTPPQALTQSTRLKQKQHSPKNGTANPGELQQNEMRMVDSLLPARQENVGVFEAIVLAGERHNSHLNKEIPERFELCLDKITRNPSTLQKVSCLLSIITFYDKSTPDPCVLSEQSVIQSKIKTP